MLVNCACRYAVEALLINEFHDAEGFHFTVSYHCVASSEKQPEVPVKGDDILDTFGFGASWNNLTCDMGILCAFIVINLTLTFLLFKFRGRPGEPNFGTRFQHFVVKLPLNRMRTQNHLNLGVQGRDFGPIDEAAPLLD